jgi:hypothetical protein
MRGSAQQDTDFVLQARPRLLVFHPVKHHARGGQRAKVPTVWNVVRTQIACSIRCHLGIPNDVINGREPARSVSEHPSADHVNDA